MISSVVSSVTDGLNNAANLSDTAGDVFGSGSDGLSAELTGEDGALRKCPVDIFSERASMCRERQGAATGLAVSALNHVVHRMTVISRVDAALAAEGINPTDEVVARGSTSGMTKVEVEALLTGRAMSLISKMDELSELYDIAGNPTVSIDHSRGNVAGHTTGTCEIFLAHRAFRNYRTLFLSIGHELYHSALVYTGHWNKWKGFTQSNGMLKNYSEYLSWSWDDYWGGTSNAIEYYDSRMVNKFGKWYPFYLK